MAGGSSSDEGFCLFPLFQEELGLERVWWLEGPELGLEQSSVLLGNRRNFEAGRGWNVDLSPSHRADKGQNHPEFMVTKEWLTRH